jgi:hypothetical protein
MTVSGLIAQAGFAIETTVGTRVTPTSFVEFNSESLRLQIERIEREGLRAGRRTHHGWSPGVRMTEGQLALDLSAETVGTLFRAALGSAVSSTSGAPYTHTFTMGDLPSLTIQIGKPSVDGVVRPFDYVGSFVRAWELSAQPNEHAVMSLDITGKNELTDQSLASASYAQTNWFTYVHGKLEIAGSEVCIDSFSLSADNGLETYHQICSTDAGVPVIRESARRNYGGTFQADFQNLTAYNRYVNGTEATLELEFVVSTAASLTITGNVRFDGETPQVSGPEIVKQTLPFKFVSNTSDANAFTAVLVNSDSSV